MTSNQKFEPQKGDVHILRDILESELSLEGFKLGLAIAPLSEKVYNLVSEYHGTITAEHNDGLIRGPYLPEMYGNEVYQLFKEVKEIFDPKNIFNPHKKADATFEYSWNHVIDNHDQVHIPGS